MNPRRQAPAGRTTAPRRAGAERQLQRLIFRCTAAVLLMAAGCGGLPGKSQGTPHRTYLLQGSGTPGISASATARHCLSLRVGAPAAAPGYGTARMAYTKAPQRLDYFAYHEWVDSPARMIGAAIGARLDASGLLGAIVTGSSEVRTDLRLDAELQRLQQDFTGAGSVLDLSIKVSLVDVTRRSLVSAKTFSYKEAAGGDPETGVAAANLALERFLGELTEFVADSIAGLACPAES
jgi:cholesterol transport system auxiliary component